MKRFQVDFSPQLVVQKKKVCIAFGEASNYHGS